MTSMDEKLRTSVMATVGARSWTNGSIWKADPDRKHSRTSVFSPRCVTPAQTCEDARNVVASSYRRLQSDPSYCLASAVSPGILTSEGSRKSIVQLFHDFWRRR